MKEIDVTNLPDATGTPCDGCQRCCYTEYVEVLPHEAHKYPTFAHAGRTFLQRGKDGRCVYLTDDGCFAYEDMPVMCRTFDCAVVFKAGHQSILPLSVRERAKELISQGYDPEVPPAVERALRGIRESKFEG